jgi:hypothetical protein
MEDGVEAEESDRMRGWESKLFMLVVVLRLLRRFVCSNCSKCIGEFDDGELVVVDLMACC